MVYEELKVKHFHFSEAVNLYLFESGYLVIDDYDDVNAIIVDDQPIYRTNSGRYFILDEGEGYNEGYIDQLVLERALGREPHGVMHANGLQGDCRLRNLREVSE